MHKSGTEARPGGGPGRRVIVVQGGDVRYAAARQAVTDYAGSLQRLALSGTLWTIGAPLLLAFGWHVVVGRRVASREPLEPGGGRPGLLVRGVGIASIVAASVATVTHDRVIARGPAAMRATLFEPLMPCVRVGRLDVTIDLWFDRSSAVACGVVCIVALVASGLLARAPVSPTDWRAWAWLELTVAGALIASMADGFVTMALGWTLVTLAATWLASWSDARAAVVTATRGAAGVAALTSAGSLLFWGLGGVWRDAEYAPDPQPRILAVRSDEEAASGAIQGAEDETEEPAPGFLTLTSMQGAGVFVDDARAPAMRSPFVRAALPAGSHVLRIHPGGLASDAIVGPFTVGSGDAITLVQLGPTLSFRETAAQRAAAESRSEDDARQAPADRGSPLGTRVVAAALAIAALAAAAMCAVWPRGGLPAGLRVASHAVGVVLGVFLLARLAFLAPLLDPHRGTRTVVGLAAAIAALALGLFRRGPALERLIFAGVPERVGALVVSFERWVIDGIGGAFVSFVRAAAWFAAHADAEIIGGPADVAASRVGRLARGAEVLTGQPLGRAAWALVVVLVSLALGHAVWPAR